jgi:hypothetical protein
MTQKRMRLIRDAIIAIAVACVLVGSWELVGWLASIGTSAPDAQLAKGLVEPTPQRPDP